MAIDAQAASATIYQVTAKSDSLLSTDGPLGCGSLRITPHPRSQHHPGWNAINGGGKE
jgi:hypothetical protein